MKKRARYVIEKAESYGPETFYSWRLIAANGRTICESDGGFSRRWDVERSAIDHSRIARDALTTAALFGLRGGKLR